MNKREFSRFKSELDIQIASCLSPEELNDTNFYLSKSKDLSQTGLLFYHNNSLPISSILEIYCHLPNDSSPLSLTGRIVRVEEVIPQKKYEIGIVFNRLGDYEIELLNQHLETLII